MKTLMHLQFKELVIRPILIVMEMVFLTTLILMMIMMEFLMLQKKQIVIWQMAIK